MHTSHRPSTCWLNCNKMTLRQKIAMLALHSFSSGHRQGCRQNLFRGWQNGKRQKGSARPLFGLAEPLNHKAEKKLRRIWTPWVKAHLLAPTKL